MSKQVKLPDIRQDQLDAELAEMLASMASELRPEAPPGWYTIAELAAASGLQPRQMREIATGMATKGIWERMKGYRNGRFGLFYCKNEKAQKGK